jgi:hypothetical protein
MNHDFQSQFSYEDKNTEKKQASISSDGDEDEKRNVAADHSQKRPQPTNTDTSCEEKRQKAYIRN